MPRLSPGRGRKRNGVRAERRCEKAGGKARWQKKRGDDPCRPARLINEMAGLRERVWRGQETGWSGGDTSPLGTKGTPKASITTHLWRHAAQFPFVPFRGLCRPAVACVRPSWPSGGAGSGGQQCDSGMLGGQSDRAVDRTRSSLPDRVRLSRRRHRPQSTRSRALRLGPSFNQPSISSAASCLFLDRSAVVLCAYTEMCLHRLHADI